MRVSLKEGASYEKSGRGEGSSLHDEADLA